MTKEQGIDSDLARIIDAWPALPVDVKAAILELVEKALDHKAVSARPDAPGTR